MSNRRLTVVIPTFNRLECLSNCLSSLAQQVEKPAEILVVNDGGADVAGVVRGFGSALAVRVTRTERVGPGRARNVAIDLVQTEYVGFLDDDSSADPSWVAACTRLFDLEPTVTAQLGRILWARPEPPPGRLGSLVPGFRQKIFDSRHDLYSDPRFRLALQVALHGSIPGNLPGVATHLSGGNSAIRTEFLRRHGGFDPRFQTLSDREMAWRILRSGGLIAYNPEMAVKHLHDPSLARALRRCFLTAPYQKLLAEEYADPPWARLSQSDRHRDLIRFEMTTTEKAFAFVHRIIHWLGLKLPVPRVGDPLVSGRATGK